MRIRKWVFLLLTLLLAAVWLPASAASERADKVEFRQADGSLKQMKGYSAYYTLLADGTARLDRVYMPQEQTTVQLPSRVDGHTVSAINGEDAMSVYNVTHYIIPPEIVGVFNETGPYRGDMGRAVTFGAAVEKVTVMEGNPAFTATEDGLLILDGEMVGCVGRETRSRVEVPEGVTKVNLASLSEFSRLICITLPATLQEVHYAPHTGSLSAVPGALTNIEVAEGNPIVRSVNNMLIVGDTLVCCPPGNLTTRLLVPDGVRVIGPGAFMGFENLKQVTLPDSVELIADGAFATTPRLEKINLPAKVVVTEGAFTRCFWLETVELSPDNPHYRIEDNLLIDKDNKVLLAWGVSGSYFKLPESVRHIGDYAFSSRVRLQTVVLHEGVETIGTHAFFGMDLTSMELPSSVRELGFGAFSCCEKMTAFTFAGNKTSLTAVPEECFYFCESLEQLHFPAGCAITSIGPDALTYCRSLKELTLPGCLTELGAESLWCCEKLTRLVLPASLKRLDLNVFYGCSKLKEVLVMGTPAVTGRTDLENTIFAAENRQTYLALRENGVDAALLHYWMLTQGPYHAVSCTDEQIQQLLDAGGSLTLRVEMRERDVSYGWDVYKNSVRTGKETCYVLVMTLTTPAGETENREYTMTALDTERFAFNDAYYAYKLEGLDQLTMSSAAWTMTLRCGGQE